LVRGDTNQGGGKKFTIGIQIKTLQRNHDAMKAKVGNKKNPDNQLAGILYSLVVEN